MDRIVWLDIETTGLSIDNDYILEIGMKITDLHLRVLAEKAWVIGARNDSSDEAYDRNLRINEVFKAKSKGPTHDDYFVSAMHHKSGLFDDVMKSNLTTADVQRGAIQWLIDEGITPSTYPTAGSTISFDRARLGWSMPNLDNFFHYRVIDVSTIKNLARLYMPSLAGEVKKNLGANQAEHRALSDIDQSIWELSFYMENRFIDISE